MSKLHYTDYLILHLLFEADNNHWSPYVGIEVGSRGHMLSMMTIFEQMGLVRAETNFHYPAYSLTEAGVELAGRLQRDVDHDFYDPETLFPPRPKLARNQYRKHLHRLMELKVACQKISDRDEYEPTPEEEAIQKEMGTYRANPEWAEEIAYLDEIRELGYRDGYSSCGGDEAYESWAH